VGGEDRATPEHHDDESGLSQVGLDPKKRSLGAAERNEEQRRDWWKVIRHLDPDRLVFIDESGANITLVPRYGRAPKGARCPGSQPRGHYRHLTLFASLSLTGMEAPMIMEGAADRLSFQAYIEQVLIPTLRPGQVVILDNLSVHKQAALTHAIEAVGCEVLFLPTYSPDFNPIEQAFAKIKQLLRQAQAKTTETLMDAIAAAIRQVTLADAAGFFRGCGYLPREFSETL
jgi:transposase